MQIVISRKDLKKSLIQPFLSGALGGMMSTVLLQPFDVLRTRYQISSLGVNNEIRAFFINDQGLLDLNRLKLLWSGTLPALTKCVPGIGLYFSFISISQSYLADYPLFQGFVCRAAVSAIFTPIMIVKTRAESSLSSKALLSSMQNIYLNENGLRGLYKGMISSILRDSPYSGLFLFSYSKFKTADKALGINSPKPFLSFLASFVATFVTQPYDLIRTYRQLNLADNRSSLALYDKLYQDNGISGFWKGFLLRLMRRSCMSVITWSIYENYT